MSKSLFECIEIKQNDGTWKLFKVPSNQYNTFSIDALGAKHRIIEIYHPSMTYEMPTDLDPETKAIVENVKAYNPQCCMLSVLDDLHDKIFDRYSDRKKDEDITNYIVNMADRLGYVKDLTSNIQTHEDKMESIGDDLSFALGVLVLRYSIQSLVEETLNRCVSVYDIRIIYWEE